MLPIENRCLPGIFEAKWRPRADAVHPAGDAERVGRRRKPHAHRLPDVLAHVAIDVVIAWNDEQSIEPDGELLAQCAQKIGDFGVLFRLAGLSGVAGEEDEMDRPFFLEERFEMPPPRITENPTPAPRLLFAWAFRV